MELTILCVFTAVLCVKRCVLWTLERLQRENERLVQQVETLKSRLDESSEIQQLTAMLQQSHR